MQILQIRLGFANNSSSSHSIIVVPPGTEKSVIAVPAEGEYGWDNFTLLTREEKMDYLGTLVFSRLRSLLGNELAQACTEELLEESYVHKDQMVDHQSIIDFPVEFDRSGLNREFIQDFRDWLLRDEVVVLGGNDNDDEGHPFALPYQSGGLEKTPIEFDSSAGHVTAVKDEGSGIWTVFSRVTGDKVRFAFEPSEPLKNIPPSDWSNYPAATPALVDVKITDFCTSGCEYCYQASTPSGKHASLAVMAEIAQELSAAKVFEVALGGGEPTQHPHFKDILKLFSDAHIVPNFTTRQLDWIGSKGSEEILRLAGSFAMSINTLEDLEKAVAAWADRPNPVEAGDGEREQMAFQVVVGTTPPEELQKIVEWFAHEDRLGFSLTLLGFKDIGRGSRWAEEQDAVIKAETVAWWKTIQNALKGKPRWVKEGFRVGIDTALALQSQSFLSKKVPAWLFHTQEGSTSMYIDAVHRVLAPSSYAPKHQYAPWLAQTWRAEFAHFNSLSDKNRKEPKKGKMTCPS